MFKVDLHTHSSLSPDGGITKAQYRHALQSGVLDVIAITDHNETTLALELQQELGDKIIVGEEIMTSLGEIIGLYLTATIPGGLSPQETVKRIQDQGGLVYIPHPFETVRKGMGPETLDELIDHIDIMEICNGRAFMQNRSGQAVLWSRLNNKPGAASSDAHGIRGLGKTHSDLVEMPNKHTLVQLVDRAVLRTSHPSPRALLYPKYHRMRKRLKKTS